MVEWTREALLESHSDEKRLREASLAKLNTRYKKLQGYIDQCYDDKIEGLIDTDMWKGRTAKWNDEKADILSRIKAFDKVNTSYLEEGVKLMELAEKAPQLFKLMNMSEKKEIVNLVLSNSQVKDGTVQYYYRKPFSVFANVVDFLKWRERRDSNSRPPA